MVSIITPISIKDVFTYGFKSKIFNNSQIKVHIICGRLTRFILSVFFSIDWVKYHDESKLLKKIGGKVKLNKYILLNN
jgi:hypothetical protein